jgi:hypothetical protein
MPKQDFCSGVDLKSKLVCYHASGCKCGKFLSVFKPLNTGKHINSVKYFSNTKASVSDPSPKMDLKKRKNAGRFAWSFDVLVSYLKN